MPKPTDWSHFPEVQYSGYATNFADQKDLLRYQKAKAAGKSERQALAVGDNGIGAPSLGTVSTPNSYGVAVPTSFLRQHFGNDPAAWRTARAQVTYGDTTIQVPYVDVGPGKKQQSKGVITDLTYPLSQGLGTGDMSKVTIKPLPNAGVDYNTNKEDWQTEQGQIQQQLQAKTGYVGIGAEPSPTPFVMPSSAAPEEPSQIATTTPNVYPTIASDQPATTPSPPSTLAWEHFPESEFDTVNYNPAS
jgi:hypothetical protein